MRQTFGGMQMIRPVFKTELAKRTVTALIFAWLTSAAVDLAISTGFGLGLALMPPFSYWVLYGLLGLGASIFLGFIFSIVRISFELSIALWVGLQAVTGFRSLQNVWMTIAIIAAVWTALMLARRFSVSPRITGSRVGIACGIALALWPTGKTLFPPSISYNPNLTVLVPALLAGVIFLLLSVVGGHTDNRSRRLGEVALFLSILGLSVVGVYQWRALLESKFPAYSREGHNPDRPHIVLIVMDTVRADRMSVYGYHRPTTPQLENFIVRNDNAVIYPLAFANSNWTLPSHTSLLTGLLPHVHGTHSRSPLSAISGWERFGLNAEQTLAELLRSTNYRNAAIVSNMTIRRSPGLRRGFDLWLGLARTESPRLLGEIVRRTIFEEALLWTFPLNASAASVNDGILAFFRACEPGPCFVFANYMETHAPYIPPPPHADIFTNGSTDLPARHLPTPNDSAKDLQYFSDRYDEELHGLDAGLGELFDALEARGILDSAWVVITSDHGESFGEHGVTQHTSSLFNEQVRVPLIIKPPRGVRIEKITAPVSLIDVAATLAQIGASKSLGVGDSLLDASVPRKPVQMQYFGGSQTYSTVLKEAIRAVADGHLKLIDTNNIQQIFDLENDLTEKNDLFFETPFAERARLMRTMPPMVVPEIINDEIEADSISKDQKEMLEALGYIQ
jgi:arylsulfatase A-like enzyme